MFLAELAFKPMKLPSETAFVGTFGLWLIVEYKFATRNLKNRPKGTFVTKY